MADGPTPDTHAFLAPGQFIIILPDQNVLKEEAFQCFTKLSLKHSHEKGGAKIWILEKRERKKAIVELKKKGMYLESHVAYDGLPKHESVQVAMNGRILIKFDGLSASLYWDFTYNNTKEGRLINETKGTFVGHHAVSAFLCSSFGCTTLDELNEQRRGESLVLNARIDSYYKVLLTTAEYRQSTEYAELKTQEHMTNLERLPEPMAPLLSDTWRNMGCSKGQLVKL